MRSPSCTTSRTVSLVASNSQRTDKLALYTAGNNFIRVQKTLKMSPAIADGRANTLWSMEDRCRIIDDVAPKPGKHGPLNLRLLRQLS